MKIENKRQWVGELFFLLGTILYITYYFFYIAYYWYVEKDPTRQIPVQRLFYIGLICFVVKIILTKYQWKEVIIGAAGALMTEKGFSDQICLCLIGYICKALCPVYGICTCIEKRL